MGPTPSKKEEQGDLYKMYGESNAAVAKEPANRTESEDSEDSQDSEEEFHRKPMFRRPKKALVPQLDQSQRKIDTLAKFQQTVHKPTQTVHVVDDRDDLEPEKEWLQWVEREKARGAREHERLASIEAEYEQKMERAAKRPRVHRR